MAKSRFTKRNWFVFFGVLIFVAVLSLTAAIGLHFYVGHKFEAESLSENFEEKLALGKGFTLDDLLEDEGYEYGWVKSGNIDVEVFAKNASGEYVLTEQVLAYNADAQKFDVVGVAEGKITFTYRVDKTVNFSVPFTAKFSSADTQTLLQNSTPELVADGIMERDEIASVETLIIKSATVDAADLQHFANLKKLHLQTAEELAAVSFTNLTLPKDTHIYVPSAKYDEYMSSKDGCWLGNKDRIFIATELANEVNVLFYKQGGELANDDGNAYDYAMISGGNSLPLSENYAITRQGYVFEGWFIGTQEGSTLLQKVNDEYSFVNDVKLYAKWTAYTYTVNAHLNRGDQTEVATKTFTYDKEGAIIDELPAYEGCTLLGWAYLANAHAPDFACDAAVCNLTDELNGEVDLYAVWAYNQFTVELYNSTTEWNTEQTEKTTTWMKHDQIVCVYGEDIILSTNAGQPTDAIAGDYKGWAKSEDSVKADYAYGETVSGLYVTLSEGNTIKLYAVYEPTEYAVYYYRTKGGEVLDTTEHLQRGQALTLHGAIYKDGYKFMGWKDDSGFIYTPFEWYADADTKHRKYTPNYQLLEGIETTNPRVNLYAVWDVNTFIVKFAKASSDSTERVLSQATVTYGTAHTFSGSTSREGHSLISYSTSVLGVTFTGKALTNAQVAQLYTALLGNAKDNDFNRNATVTFTPSWKLNSYKLSWTESNTTTTVTTSAGANVASGQYVPFGTRLTISVSANDGYQNATCDVSSPFTMPDYDVSFESSATAIPEEEDPTSCFVKGSLLTLADGSQTAVENVALGDEILVFDHTTGKLSSSKIVFLFAADVVDYKIMTLHFEGGVQVKVVNMHGFFDCDLNEYAMLDYQNIGEYVGHKFYYTAWTGEQFEAQKLELLSYSFTYETTTRYTLVTAYQINHIVNGMLAVSDEIEGLYNVFALNEDMTVNTEKYYADIQKYGLASYEEWSEYLTEEEFAFFNGQYINVSIGKGLTTRETLIALIKKYFHPQL